MQIPLPLLYNKSGPAATLQAVDVPMRKLRVLSYFELCHAMLAVLALLSPLCLSHRACNDLSILHHHSFSCCCSSFSFSCVRHSPTQPNAALNAGEKYRWGNKHDQSNREEEKKPKIAIRSSRKTRLESRQNLVERLDHSLLVGGVDRAGSHALAELEDRLHNAQLSRRGVQTGHGHPVVDHHAGADNGATAVHTTSHKGNLQQRAELVLVLDAGLGVHDAALVAEAHVAAGQDVVRNGLAEDLDAEHVGDDFLGLALEVGVHEGDVVVGADDIAECGEALFDSLDLHAVGDAVAQVLQLLVGGRGRDQQAFAVAGGQAADDARAGDGGVADGDDILELGFEDAVGRRGWLA